MPEIERLWNQKEQQCSQDHHDRPSHMRNPGVYLHQPRCKWRHEQIRRQIRSTNPQEGRSSVFFRCNIRDSHEEQTRCHWIPTTEYRKSSIRPDSLQAEHLPVPSDDLSPASAQGELHQVHKDNRPASEAVGCPAERDSEDEVRKAIEEVRVAVDSSKVVLYGCDFAPHFIYAADCSWPDAVSGEVEFGGVVGFVVAVAYRISSVFCALKTGVMVCTHISPIRKCESAGSPVVDLRMK